MGDGDKGKKEGGRGYDYGEAEERRGGDGERDDLAGSAGTPNLAKAPARARRALR